MPIELPNEDLPYVPYAPSIVPDVIPIGVPVEHPAPRPSWVPSPWPGHVPGTPAEQFPQTGPVRPPIPPGRPGLDPGEPPDTGGGSGGGPKPGARHPRLGRILRQVVRDRFRLETKPKRDVQTNTPPKPVKAGVKERKIRLSGPGVQALLGAVGKVTEFCDLVDALHDALPKQFQSRARGCTGRALAVYDHIGRVDIEDALWNIFLNQVEDTAFGFAGKNLGDAARSWGDATGRPVGFQTGPLH